jgi:YD repeat-containing protein
MITRAGNSRFEHDRLGRVVLKQQTRLSRKPQTWRYAWDSESRLTSVVTPDGTSGTTVTTTGPAHRQAASRGRR